MKVERRSYSEKMEEHINEVFYYWDFVYVHLSNKYGKTFVESHPEVVSTLVQSIATKDLESSILDMSHDMIDSQKELQEKCDSISSAISEITFLLEKKTL
ncbi:hypothetical protein [uncultured Bacteroides sp.]|uniref:hypothetical protein n=1 Tax=uncultured Bacteroides sp. TaxID=162156 RepID=UPI00263620AF|nr:hypothetical protein [uncultured Bacteroides sp.]